MNLLNKNDQMKQLLTNSDFSFAHIGTSFIGNDTRVNTDSASWHPMYS
jgi:hypothetical protein